MPDDEDKWPEQAHIEEDMDLLNQLPTESTEPASILGVYEPGQIPWQKETGTMYDYGTPYDKVLCIPRHYTSEEAEKRLSGLCKEDGWVRTQAKFYTARHWCLRVVKA